MSCRYLSAVDAVHDRRQIPAALTAHQATCPSCRARAAALAALRPALVALRVPARDAFAIRRDRHRLVAAFAADGPRPHRSRTAILAFAAFAVAAIALLSARSEPSAVMVEATAAHWSRHDEPGATVVQLDDGQLALHVHHGAAPHALVVSLPDGELRDLGTTFRVTVVAGRTREVTVTEGAVVLRLVGRAPVVVVAGARWSAESQVAESAAAPAPVATSASAPVQGSAAGAVPAPAVAAPAPTGAAAPASGSASLAVSRSAPAPIGAAAPASGSGSLAVSRSAPAPKGAAAPASAAVAAPASAAVATRAGVAAPAAARAPAGLPVPAAVAVPTPDAASMRGSSVALAPDIAGEFRAAVRLFDTGDPAAAGALAGFVARHGDDVRAEDASYLLVVVLARHDVPAARAAARTYLTRYPQGFRRHDVAALAR